MTELLYKKITEIISLTDEEFALVKSFFLPKKLRKRQYLLQEGDVCRYQAFVEKGILRSFTVDEKDGEHTLQFASEGWWMADLASFLTDEPSIFNMEALEEAEVLLIDKPSWNQAMETVPKLEHYFRILMQNHLVATQKRLMQSLAEPAEARYKRFSITYPDCVQRVPQHMIASYLGITRETLSRLRKQITLSK
ncbi:Crp/Fnr family transcriptional regulator [Flavisolibacter tropicus]|uniref:Cyclic nucleotide-binding protein n=1 Tax=Flavisolibacter tropicus TaxID=1492898 RepID=A0A172TXT4_9BACT|nr:Crp/Fnr family transcriptional regulator [Flavisolibacter tropicus]ANE51547.1 cyclic nucleotide-binding protein [Flavisolibacter tropicus]